MCLKDLSFILPLRVPKRPIFRLYKRPQHLCVRASLCASACICVRARAQRLCRLTRQEPGLPYRFWCFFCNAGLPEGGLVLVSSYIVLAFIKLSKGSFRTLQSEELKPKRQGRSKTCLFSHRQMGCFCFDQRFSWLKGEAGREEPVKVCWPSRCRVSAALEAVAVLCWAGGGVCGSPPAPPYSSWIYLRGALGTRSLRRLAISAVPRERPLVPPFVLQKR